MKIFISYSSADRLHAFELFNILEKEKYEPWLDYFDIMPSENLEKELTGSIEKADILCIIFSPNSMSSKWVEYEIKTAAKSKTPPRVLGIIVHSCEIPAYISDIIHLDARGGMEDPGFIARLKRAIDKKEILEQELLLDTARKMELANQSVIERADTESPLHIDEINLLADKKIDSIDIRIDPASFNNQTKVIYELRLNLDRLLNEPMHFFFTRYEEGRTWPKEFDFLEPSYKNFFMAIKPKIDGKFKWYDDVYDFIDKQDGTDFKDMPAEFSFEFTGKEFYKGKGSLLRKEKLDFPTIGELLKDQCSFELIAHYPESKSVQQLNPFNAEIDISFRASIKEEKKWVLLFKSRHDRVEELAWSSGFMKSQPSMIYREMMMEGFVSPDDIARNRKRDIATALHEGKELESRDYSPGGMYASSQGNLFFFRTNYLEASKWYLKAIDLLQPAVFDKFPTYKEAMMLFHSCERLADCVDVKRNATLKAKYINNLLIVGQQLVDKFPEEMDYQRLMARAFFSNADMHNYLQETEKSAEELTASIAILEAIHQRVSSAENYKELCEYKVLAVRSFSDSPVAKLAPLQQWRKELSLLNKHSDEILEKDKLKQQQGPAWLQDASDKHWPVELFNTPLLRYSLAIPKRWNATPILSTTQMEVKHLFKGPWPSEFLAVSFMEKSTGGNMKNWVDGIMQLTGLPVLEISTDTKPVLSEWSYEGAFDVVAQKYAAEEAHCYSGVIELNDQGRHRARVYILLLRKGTFSWKFVLSFETGLFRGIEDAVIYKEDHVRAGSTFGKLKLE